MNNQDSVNKKEVFKAMFFAILLAFLGIGILGWQYRNLEKERIPLIEEEIEKQKAELQQKSAESILDKFIAARIGGNEDWAIGYITEGAVQQKNNKDFILINDFTRYEIIKVEKIEDKFRFAVKLYEKGIGDFVEIITLIKILDKYYVDSVEIAG